ncbi:hypothetical protein L1887_14889 [Cichorium endivia]|nr:hypothetical protein L1887_14889 [Cichorium endivia]
MTAKGGCIVNGWKRFRRIPANEIGCTNGFNRKSFLSDNRRREMMEVDCLRRCCLRSLRCEGDEKKGTTMIAGSA